MTTGQADFDDDPQLARARARVGMLLRDKWRLDSLIGVGGMAAVYAATHRNGKRVAVKMLHEELSHESEVRTRFLREGYAANTIQHEGVVSVLDDDIAPDGSAFIVMELLEGETVDRRWERQGRKFSVEEALVVSDQLLDVLAAAHARNVVHRDVKPENLFITKAGVLKVLDFGIAKVFERTESRPTATQAGMVMGTPAFMAPEQALARWDQVDGRTDLWAVGATIFTLLSGRHVHDAPSSHELLILSATSPAPALASVAPGVPADVAAVVDKSLAFDRGGRWPDARAMQRAIRDLLQSMGHAMPAMPTESSILAVPRAGPLSAAATVASARTPSQSPATLAADRELRQTEVSRLRTVVTDLDERYTTTKARVAAAQSKLEAGQAERRSLEQWFSRRVGTRTAALGEARGTVRQHMVEIARRAIAEPSAFGVEFVPLRERALTLGAAAASAARDVSTHEAALEAHDPRALRRGVLITALLVIVLVIIPVIWRATRVIEPQLPHPTDVRR
jgi:serine/threonine protein kinase